MSAQPKKRGPRISAGRPSNTAKTVDVDAPRRPQSQAILLTRNRGRGPTALATTPMPSTTRAEVLRGHDAVGPAARHVTGDALAIVVTKRPWMAQHVGRMLAWQSLPPKGVIVCSSIPQYEIAPIQQLIPAIPVLFVPGDADATLGALRNKAMQAGSDLSPSAILCTIDDDDCYGVHYLAGIVDAWQRHPAALVVGLGSFETRNVSAPPSEPLTQSSRGRTGLRAAISGATISVPASAWRERTELRYPDVGIGEDIEFLKIAQRENRVAAAHFGDFVALRYSDPQHQHTSPNGTQAR